MAVRARAAEGAGATRGRRVPAPPAVSITVLVPVLGRPHRVAPFLRSLEPTGRFVGVVPMFLCSPGDDDEIGACRATGAPTHVVTWEPGPGDYAKKINLGAGCARSEFVLLGADDLHFHPGWALRALACHAETGACVVGTNDMGNPRVMRGEHSTHTLVHRDYVGCGTIDEPDGGKLLHEGYSHSFSDTEFVETAMARQTWAHAGDSIVEHEHPLWGKADQDETYRRATEGFGRDEQLYEQRRHMWQT